ncbi:TIGR04282 family arsenosugar biosynthesis glycosyltransferase [Tengunoibacter tsumagoiensis]|uniref:Glycosyl transferase n=1 Tax=Tengunoibacter tsumagoiensis TaxID=2014871 RepID=A0A402A3L9_9CHLR|nr:TIGR04282 family arsenosugar biosynthesis glycosyltransferase [Tengunoibacter tsumagoiensis]GCE13743.1 hypothetical protein KTT_36020 [Tengunoibacter tsumagoiensis]
MSDTALVIMARYPQSGQTKTRLARSIGETATLTLYQAFLQDLAQRFAQIPALDLHWAYTPAEVDYAAFLQTLVPGIVARCFPQEGADFAARLLHAFQWLHSQGYKQIILIGSDSPQISLDCIITAHKKLQEADIVLGPAEDGGYYLIAMKKPFDVFSGIPMSTEVVLEQTIILAKQQGLNIETLDPLFDIDEVSELVRLAAQLSVAPEQAPQTALQLVRLQQEGTLQPVGSYPYSQPTQSVHHQIFTPDRS